MSPSSKKLWFRAKHYGYGWTPSTEEGLLVVTAYIASIVIGSCYFAYFQGVLSDRIWINSFLLYVLGVTLLLFIICYEKGEKLRFKWGKGNKKK